jgi:protoporphyrinogen/coproporphyrinogen III oxidase
MESRDVVVVGGGISGLAFAYHAARAGKKVLVLEGADRVGGCLDSRQVAGGYWYELGAHTCYNSYGRLLEIIEGTGIADRILPRGEARKRFAFLQDGRLSTMGPLSVFARFDWVELLRSLAGSLGASKEGATTYAHWSRRVGKKNYARVLAPFLSAVPSQSVDAFPAAGPGSLFKKRARRKDVVKSFTLQGGLGTVADAVARAPGVEVITGALVREVRRAGAGFEVQLQDGRAFAAPVAALAVPPSMASALLRSGFPEVSGELSRVKMTAVETVGVAVPRARVTLPEMAFLVPAHDIFWSAVTRDPVPDPERRAFAFHFRTGHTDAEKMGRIREILGVAEGDLLDQARRMTVLPSPVLGHDHTVAELDRLLAGSRLALTGNYFDGLAIEDCVARSASEWARVARAGAP